MTSYDAYDEIPLRVASTKAYNADSDWTYAQSFSTKSTI